jgi:hypothetical protein
MLYRFIVRERHCSPAIVAAFYCCEAPRPLLSKVGATGLDRRHSEYSGKLRYVNSNQYYILSVCL